MPGRSYTTVPGRLRGPSVCTCRERIVSIRRISPVLKTLPMRVVIRRQSAQVLIPPRWYRDPRRSASKSLTDVDARESFSLQLHHGIEPLIRLVPPIESSTLSSSANHILLWRLVRVGQEEYLNLEQDAMVAEAGEEDEFIKCCDDITGKELPLQAVTEAREKDLKYLRELLACMKRSMSTTSPQSTQRGPTLTKHLRESRCKSVHELLP